MKESSRSFSQFVENKPAQRVLFPSTVFPKKKIDSYYKTAHYLAEYNQISEQRIRQFVSQIRENLTLNGNSKVRPSRITLQFTPYNRSSKTKGIHFLKRPTLRYDALSRLRLYWALSKGGSNLVISGTSGYPPSTNNLNPHFYNKRKQLWTKEKFRQQEKENKTKKLSKDLKTKFKSFLNDTPYFMLQDRSSLTDAMLFKSLKKIRIQNEKLYSLSFVHNKQSNLVAVFKKNGTRIKSLRDFINENYDLRQLKIRHNRLKNSLTGTAKTHPFISGKTSYWWLQFKPTTINGLGSSISNSINSGSSIQNIFGQNPYSSSYNKDIQKSLIRSNDSTYINSSGPTIHKQSNQSFLQINTLLFHFCSLITLLSISQIRGLLKFTFIGLNKIFTLFERLTPSSLYKPFFNKSLNLFGSGSSFDKTKFSRADVRKSDGLRTSDGAVLPQVALANTTTEFSFVPQNQVGSRINNQPLGILDPFFLTTPTVVFKNGRGGLALQKRDRNKTFGLNRAYIDRFLQYKVFDLNKRNDSFVYLFYTTPLANNLLSSSIPLAQNGSTQSFLKTSLKELSPQKFFDTIERQK